MQGVSPVNIVILAIIAFLVIHICCIIYLAKTGKRIDIIKEISIWLVISYAAFIVMITFLNREPGSRGGINTKLYFGTFSGDYFGMQQMVYSILNVILFVPWGAFLTLLCKNTATIKRFVFVTMYCFLTTCTIETVQLITGRGYFELTDIVTNLEGGIIGSLLMGAVIGICNKIRKK